MAPGGTLGLVAALVIGGWGALVTAIAVGRLRRRPDERSAGAYSPVDAATRAVLQSTADDEEARVVVLRGLRSSEQDVRVASVTALARLGHRYEWAVDGLIEALADDRASPIRVGSALEDLAPRPGVRLVPLLRHPRVVVRFTTVRLLGRYPDLARRHVADLTRDPSHQVRAAALETLRATSTAEALRCATALLDDAHPLVRAQAAATATAVAGAACATLLVPLLGDESWAVRDATQAALAEAGNDVADAMLDALEHPNAEVRAGAALVLQDIGVVDDLARDDRNGHLERILEVGGNRMRQAASGRVRRGVTLGVPVLGAETA
jgi:HEAT repeat protein